MNKKGNLTLFFIFMIFALILVITTSMIAPMGVRTSTKLYTFGEQLLSKSVDSLDEISNNAVRESINETINDAMDSSQTNIEVSSGIYQYGWLILLFMTFIFLMLIGRSIAETNRFGGFNGFA